MKLEDTIQDMLSDDPIDRLKAEYNQLDIRINRLKEVLDEYPEDCNIPYQVLHQQLHCMKEYRNYLINRLQIAGIRI